MKEVLQKLKLPVIVAPMFRVSGPELVIASCKNGLIGSFPAKNPRTIEQLIDWLNVINDELKDDPNASPYAVNLIMRSDRLDEEIDVMKKFKVPLIITSVGSPEKAVEEIHSYGGIVLADVATLKHAKKAIEKGVDGLILLCSGAGGNAGWNNPFAFVRAVREFYNGPIVLAGCIMDGASIHSAQVIGADLVFMGTKFIPTEESMAVPEYKEKLIEVDMDDVMTTKSFSGMTANYLRPTIESAGLDPDNLPSYEEFNNSEHRKKRWKEIWSAGQGVTAVKDILPVSQVVEQLYKEYKESVDSFKKLLV